MATPKAETLGVMQSMLDGGDMPALRKDTVRCQACRVEIDRETGAPVEPVTMENVEATRRYMNQAGQSELSGQVLVGED